MFLNMRMAWGREGKTIKILNQEVYFNKFIIICSLYWEDGGGNEGWVCFARYSLLTGMGIIFRGLSKVIIARV